LELILDGVATFKKIIIIERSNKIEKEKGYIMKIIKSSKTKFVNNPICKRNLSRCLYILHY
jgi:hypothetical protein